ncbi:hypothetical protein [Nocardioides sp.]|uniref:hypothetical protein n=1 Tax=Nocardioides sp. TaxID=35761 RepID=UPI003784B5FF
MTTKRWNPIPDEHLDPACRYHLSDHLPTRLGGNLQAARSLDPFYETFAGEGRDQGAISLSRARHMADKTPLRLPATYLRAERIRPRDILAGSRAREVLDLLGALIAFGVVTNNQAATITGSPAWADPRSNVVASLFASDLISITNPYVGHSLGAAGDGSVAYQLGDADQVRRLLSQLSYAEWLALTGGRDIGRTQVHLRHDLLGLELALRAATHLEVGTVLGPQFSTFRDLTTGCRFPSRSHGGADLTIVRDDGLRIAIEVTASITQGFTQKVNRWVRILTESPLEDTGLVVVFLLAPPLAKAGNRVRRMTHHVIEDAIKHNPDAHLALTPERIGVATWREWFPRPSIASDRFARLVIDRPTGRTSLWEECSLWEPDDLSLTARESDRLRSSIVNTALLAQTPWWLREKHHPAQLAADLLAARVGTVADVGPQRSRSATRRTGAGQGAAGDAMIPRRLAGPTDTAKGATSQPVARSGAAIGPWLPRPPEFGHRLRPVTARSVA